MLLGVVPLPAIRPSLPDAGLRPYIMSILSNGFLQYHQVAIKRNGIHINRMWLVFADGLQDLNHIVMRFLPGVHEIGKRNFCLLRSLVRIEQGDGISF